jgi:hypothetical protein
MHLAQHALRVRTAASIAVVTAALATGAAAAQDYDGFTGPQLYAKFCASCHGAEGRGDGPVAPTLNIEVPDLTRLARRPDDPFPAEQVRRIVDGREVPAAHGARRMPVWGYEFATATVGEPESGAANAAVLVGRLVDYLKTIQRRSPPPVPIAPAPPNGGKMPAARTTGEKTK